jgi:PilZ domain
MMPKESDRRTSRRNYTLKPTRIRLKGHEFEIHDLSGDGVGIILDKNGPRFVIGERLDTIPISLQSGTVSIEGVVSHISITSKFTICGIRFLFRTDEFKSIVQFIKERAYSAS